MKVSYNWLQKYFPSPLPAPDELADMLTAHVFEVEGMEKAGLPGQGEDTIYDFKVLPDRIRYLLCHRGVAREIKAISCLQMEPVETAPVKSVGETTVKVIVKENNLCRRYIAREIEGIEVKDSPAWLRERLESIGQRSINNIVDAGNFVMQDINQPLHIFDADKIKGSIVIRLAEKGEKIMLLTGAEVVLTETDLVIADDEGPLAIAGVKGGKRAEVNANTKRIVIESANFDPTSVRKTSTRLNLRNESSKRFENGITPALAGEAIEAISALVVDLSPEAKVMNPIDIYPSPAKNWQVSVPLKYITSQIGAEVPPDFINKVLNFMDCKVTGAGGNLIITPPLDRLDIAIPEDVVDEIARIWGYEKLAGELPPSITESSLPDKGFYYAEKVKNILVSRGYSETLLYSLVAKGAHQITYPLAEDKAALRETSSAKLMEALVLNSRNADLLALESVKIFEIGKVFPAGGERTSLALGVSHIKKKKGITAEGVLKDDIEFLMKELGVSLEYKIAKGDYGAICEIDFDGVVSKLAPPEKLQTLGFSPLPKDKKYSKFSVYPFVVRDIAMFVPESAGEDKMLAVIKENAGPLCIQVRLFDVFSKDGKKSLAYRLIFQSFERTLVDEEVNAQMEKIYSVLKTEGAEIR